MMGDEKIGSVLNTIPGWMAIRADGTTVQHVYWTTRKAAVEYLYHRATSFSHA